MHLNDFQIWTHHKSSQIPNSCSMMPSTNLHPSLGGSDAPGPRVSAEKERSSKIWARKRSNQWLSTICMILVGIDLLLYFFIATDLKTWRLEVISTLWIPCWLRLKSSNELITAQWCTADRSPPSFWPLPSFLPVWLDFGDSFNSFQKIGQQFRQWILFPVTSGFIARRIHVCYIW